MRREWVGAPRGTLANPTCWLFAVTVTLFGVASWAYLVGAVSAAVVIALNAVAIYLAFTVMHESMHGIAHTHRLANVCLGRERYHDTRVYPGRAAFAVPLPRGV